MLTSAIAPLFDAEPTAGNTGWQLLAALQQALTASQAEAAATWQLLALSLGEASEGVLVLDEAQGVRLTNTMLGQLFELPVFGWAGQPAAWAKGQLRMQLVAPAALDLLLAHPPTGYVPLALRSGRVVELRVQPLPAAGGYLLRSRATTPALPGAPRPAGAGGSSPFLDLTYLYTQAQGSQALITRIIKSFLRTTPPLLLELRTAADTGHWETVARLVHHLQSNMQVLGMQQAQACLEALEPPLPPASGPAATAFAQATHELANCLERALRLLPSYLPYAT